MPETTKKVKTEMKVEIDNLLSKQSELEQAHDLKKELEKEEVKNAIRIGR